MYKPLKSVYGGILIKVYNNAMHFIPLHVYSGFSYLQSGLTIEKIAKTVKSNGYEYCGLCDNGSLSGIAPFEHKIKNVNAKPVFGMDVLLPIGTLSLFVKNEEGYRNLLAIATAITEKTLTEETVINHSTGLICVYPLELSFYAESLVESEKEFARKLFEITGKFDKTLIGLPYGKENEQLVNEGRAFADKFNYLPVAFPHILYEKKEDAITLDIVNAISSKITLIDKSKDGDNYFLSDDNLKSFYTDEEIENSYKVAISCKRFSLIEKRGTLLHFENDKGLTSEECVRQLANEGLAQKGLKGEKEYEDRLSYELSIIHTMGYDDYFLIVADYVNYARDNGIYVGPGRGSAGGSLVSYCLGIIETDPLQYNLLFERFLNPERRSMPDIDVDFSDINREKVVSYLQSKYGSERVGRVLTTQTIGAKESLRDIARVYNYKEREVDTIISTITNDKLSLREDYKTTPQFKSLVDSDKFYLEMVSLASKIEGLPRQAGLHAAGVVLNNEPLNETLPVTLNPDVGYVACLEKDYLEEQGFLKMDILGLRNLTIIEICLSLIEMNRGIKLSPYEIPFEDEEAIKLICKNKTMGLFQLESPGMKRTIKDIQPTTFEDIAAIEALFRPGPMDSIPSFARRKHGTEKISYLTPELEPILKNTYGIIVYQEQIMQIASAVAGFSFGEADVFRRAISKKDKSKIQALHEKFISGCISKGKSRQLAEKLFVLIEKFADYGFNKSHAISYAVLTCRMAYLKAHYPEEFYCAILDSMAPGDKKFKDTLTEMKELGLTLSSPDINRSTKSFIVDGKTLRTPLNAIKGMQGILLNNILKERSENGPYKDIFDFAARTVEYGLNIQMLIKFIDAGAFDILHNNRSSLRTSANSVMTYASMFGSSSLAGGLLDIGIEKPMLATVDNDLRVNLEAEYETLGMMISTSPFELYRNILVGIDFVKIDDAKNAYGEFTTAGLIKNVRTIVTKKGTQMCFLEIYDDINEMSFTLFEEAYLNSYVALKKDNLVLVTGKKDRKMQDSFVGLLVRKVGD